jgi:multimeric flavodoxin WrbA
MKVLVLNGSPKREKSDTMQITRSFLKGMQEFTLQEIHIIHTVDQHIEYCSGCFSCMHNGGTCIYNDDMKSILEEILQSEAETYELIATKY